MKSRLVGVFVVACLAAMLSGPAAVATSSVTAQPISNAQRVAHGEVSTLNWSGYAVYKDGTTFSHVSADWIQPTIAPGACAKEKLQLAAFFVGIDGYNSNSVEQIGTDSDCFNGNPIYYAWYEMYPAPVTVLNCAVQGGDSIHADVQYNSGSTFTLTLTVNGNSCFSGPVTAPGTPARSSAEFVAEAPGTGNHFWPLANFQHVTFSNASITGGRRSGDIDSRSWSHDSITMVDRGRNTTTIKAQPGDLNTAGDGFTIDWVSS